MPTAPETACLLSAASQEAAKVCQAIYSVAFREAQARVSCAMFRLAACSKPGVNGTSSEHLRPAHLTEIATAEVERESIRAAWFYRLNQERAARGLPLMRPNGE